MLKGRALKVTMVKDDDTIEVDSNPDYQAMIANATVASKIAGQELTKMAVALMIVNAGCKILINRLSK